MITSTKTITPPVHRVHIVADFTETNNINTTTWPAQSSDLNIIEKVWLIFFNGLQTNVRNIKTSYELFNKIITIWESMTLNYTRKLYSTLPKRVSAAISMKSYLAKY